MQAGHLSAGSVAATVEHPMSDTTEKAEGPDFASGVAVGGLAAGGMLSGHVSGEPALLVRRGDEFFIVGATCTHYGGPLCDGVLVSDTVRCPWHHAVFSLRTGEALQAPALDDIPRWAVEFRDRSVYAGDKLSRSESSQSAPTGAPSSIVIVGGGSAGFCAADTLRREGYTGPVTILSADADLPCDRPNLSKGYLAGTVPDGWLLLRPKSFYRRHDIDVRLDARVTRIDPQARRVELADGSSVEFGALLLATGAEPVHLPIAGADLPHVHYLRTLADSRALAAAAAEAKRAVVIGAGFIGLEVASSLRARGVQVDVVAREAVPMEKVLGREVGLFIQRMHEEHGVRFHFGATVSSIDERGVTLDSSERIDADLVVIGVGVRPATAIAEAAGIEVNNGVIVDRYLETSVPGIFAAGDIARWPDATTGERVRIEHFVVAERQGQAVARNMLGRREPFADVPFFWTEQYDLGIAYVGHAEQWDDATIDGDLEARDCSITYRRDGRKLAVALIHRDHEGLLAELEFERAIAEAEGVTAEREGVRS
jgi:NADPH-dependent 2,4-dienoyl-CoA reductase/sulfur reductase-like enzyme/nitrite reductase/ring-hydroxylating ferredoxin subunit